jgi:hypothetical protein
MLKAHESPARVIEAPVTIADTNAVNAVADSQKLGRRKVGRRLKHGDWRRLISKQSSHDTFAKSGPGR